MNNLNNFDGFINEKINWGKQPWRTLKNVMNLEEPEDEEEELIKKKISPDDKVSLKFHMNLSLFHMENISSLTKALAKMAERYNLTGNVSCRGRYFYFDLEGKRKDADNFYDKVKEILYK